MRKITQEAVKAMFSRKKFKKSNTQIIVDGDYSAMLLHGNKIAEIDNYELLICTKGWKTNTTKERLNGALYELRRYYAYYPKIVQRDHQWYIEVYSTPCPVDDISKTQLYKNNTGFYWDGGKINVKKWIESAIHKLSKMH